MLFQGPQSVFVTDTGARGSENAVPMSNKSVKDMWRACVITNDVY